MTRPSDTHAASRVKSDPRSASRHSAVDLLALSASNDGGKRDALFHFPDVAQELAEGGTIYVTVVAEKIKRGDAEIKSHCDAQVVNLPQFIENSVVFVLSAAEQEVQECEVICLISTAFEATFEDRNKVWVPQHRVGEGAKNVNLGPSAQKLYLVRAREHCFG